MGKILILLSFTFIFMHLHATGNITKYINMKYSYISFITIFVLWGLTIYQMYRYYKEEKNMDEGHHHNHINCDCHHHDHHHEDDKWYKKLWSSTLLIFPIVSVLLIPAATLNSKMIEAKGFNFPILQDSDPSGIHQILAPDTSYYYGSEDYTNIMNNLMGRYKDKENLNINDKNYLESMELIYNYPGNFMDKEIELQGFTFNNSDLQKNQVFLFRFGIIHCVADSGVYGLLVDFPQNMHFHNDEWIRVKGKVSSLYYQPFKKTIPIVKVQSWEPIQKPSDEYVYKQFQY